MYDALRLRPSYFDQYTESLLQMVTTQFQIACGRPWLWDLETFTSLPTAIPNQSGLYILLLETPPAADARFGPTGLDIYCGQGHGDIKNGSVWRGLPLRLKTYEQQSREDSGKLQALRQTRGETGKTLHIYLLCSLPGVRAHARAVALVPDRLRDPIAEKDLRLDLHYGIHFGSPHGVNDVQGRPSGIRVSHTLASSVSRVGTQGPLLNRWATTSRWLRGESSHTMQPIHIQRVSSSIL